MTYDPDEREAVLIIITFLIGLAAGYLLFP
jgi:hypothetical protein